MNHILILGQHDNAEVQSIVQKATLANCQAIVLDSRAIPDQLSIEYLPEFDQTHLVLEEQSFPIAMISGVYWSRLDPPKTQQALNAEAAAATNLESTCLLQILLSETKLNWVNSFQAIQFHRTKPKQLQLAKQLGAHIPPSYIGNRVAAVQAFLARYPKAIVKPIYCGELTQLVHPHMQSIDAIKQWAQFPITLQAFIPGENIRTYIVGDFIVSALIQESYNKPSNSAQFSDYRYADSVTLVPMQIPIAIQQLAVRIMRAFHMQFTAIDWRLTPDGKFVFLEANPAPLFVNAQKQLGVEIDQGILNLLLKE